MRPDNHRNGANLVRDWDGPTISTDELKDLKLGTDLPQSWSCVVFNPWFWSSQKLTNGSSLRPSFGYASQLNSLIKFLDSVEPEPSQFTFS